MFILCTCISQLAKWTSVCVCACYKATTCHACAFRSKVINERLETWCCRTPQQKTRRPAATSEERLEARKGSQGAKRVFAYLENSVVCTEAKTRKNRPWSWPTWKKERDKGFEDESSCTSPDAGSAQNAESSTSEKSIQMLHTSFFEWTLQIFLASQNKVSKAHSNSKLEKRTIKAMSVH